MNEENLADAADAEDGRPLGAASANAPASPARRAWRRLCANRAALAAGAFVVLAFVGCFGAQVFAPEAHLTQNLALGPVAPCAAHWLGTDTLGRDLLARVLQGGRVSLQVGIVATAVSVLFGVAYGLLAGWRGGRTGALLMCGVDVLTALPFTLFVILLTVVFGGDLVLLYLAVGAVSWPNMARIVRNSTRQLREQPFVEASLCLGQSPVRVVMRHVLPNLAGVIIIYTTLTVPGVMLIEAFVSFLGLGVKPPLTSWGLLIKEGADVMEEFPWLLLFPCAAFSATLFALNFLGDGLRDALDPKASGAG
jgi:oligopeptide transport system permease protein